MRLLVAGARQVDAGKTTFTRGLVAATGAPAFKPRAANDRWGDHDSYRRAIDEGRLYGKDSYLLTTEQPQAVSVEEINPIHRLWQPTPDPDGGMFGQPHRQFVVDRVGTSFVVNGNADLPAALEAALPLRDARTVDSIAAINELMLDEYRDVQDELARTIEDRQWAIVESYGDIATPIQSLTVELVAVVEPERVRYFDGEGYANACDVNRRRSREGVLEPVVPDVIDPLRPLRTVELPPMTSAEREDAVEIAKAYRDAYEPLWSCDHDDSDRRDSLANTE